MRRKCRWSRFISGHVAETYSAVRRGGRLDVFVDRSKQNGLHEDSKTVFTVYEVFGDASATQGGVVVPLGVGVRRRIFGVCEHTRFFGDCLLLADLAAHVWGHAPSAIATLAEPRMLTSLKWIGNAPGQVVIAQLGMRPVEC